MADAQASGTFGKRGTLALVLFAALAFVAFLFLIGRGGLEGSGNNGQAHAAGTGLAGFAGLTRLLEEDGVWVERSRDRGALNDPGLLVLTPPANIDEEEFAEIIERRRTIGPTMIIAPKWFAMPAQGDRNSKPGWVHLLGASEDWAMTIDGRTLSFPHIDLKDRTARWRGLGRSGPLPSKNTLAAVEIEADDAGNNAAGDNTSDDNMGSESGFLAPLVEDGDGRMLAAYLADDGSYLDGDLYLDPESGDSAPVYGVMLVAEFPHRLGEAALRHIDADQQIAAPGEFRQHGAADAACSTCDDDDAGVAHVLVLFRFSPWTRGAGNSRRHREGPRPHWKSSRPRGRETGCGRRS